VSSGDAQDGDIDEIFDDSSYKIQNLQSDFDDVNSQANAWYYDVNYNQHTRDLRAFWDANGTQDALWGHCRAGRLCAPNQYTTDRRMSEEQTAAYVQLHFHFEPADMPVNLTLGLRYAG
jgi:hypothetical protein